MHIWDLKTKQERILQPASEVWAFSPNGQYVATGSGKNVTVWDANTGLEVRTLFGNTSFANSLAFSPDGTKLSAGCSDGTVRNWDVVSGEELLLIRLNRGVGSVAFSADGKRLFCGFVSETKYSDEVNVIDASSSQQVRILQGHMRPGWTVVFSRDGQRLASSGDDETIKLWNATNHQEILTLRGHAGPVYGIAFNSSGHRLASASYDKTTKVWNTQTGEDMMTMQGHQGGVYAVAFSPDDERLATASQDGTVKMWNANSGQELFTFRGHNPKETGRPGSRMTISGARTADEEVSDRPGRTWPFVNTVVFSPDGKWIASAGYDGAVRVWNSNNGEELHVLEGHKGRVYCVAYSRDGKRLASCASGEVKVWEAETGKIILTFKGHTAQVHGVAFSPDGERIVSSSGSSLKLWDALTGQEILTLQGGKRGISFSPDGKQLASFGTDGSVKIWDATGGKNVAKLVLPPRVSDAPDNLIDLSDHYNAGFNETWHAEGSRLSSLGTGIQKLAAVDFDVRGLIQVGANASDGTAYPKQVSGITVEQQCKQLHFLHAAIYAASTTNGVPIGTYVIHYTDGQRQEIPLRVGVEVGDWRAHAKETNTQFTVAWTGMNEASLEQDRSIRLFKTTWKNPRPEVAIATIDFLAASSPSAGRTVPAPFLVAITAAP